MLVDTTFLNFHAISKLLTNLLTLYWWLDCVYTSMHVCWTNISTTTIHKKMPIKLVEIWPSLQQIVLASLFLIKFTTQTHFIIYLMILTLYHKYILCLKRRHWSLWKFMGDIPTQNAQHQSLGHVSSHTFSFYYMNTLHMMVLIKGCGSISDATNGHTVGGLLFRRRSSG